MEVIARYGNAAQQEEWLQPLLEGTIRSCFAMTEPDVASSDATNMEATICVKGEEAVLDGTKWWTSGGSRARSLP
jgi:acyl-CoA dehydrogenase